MPQLPIIPAVSLQLSTGNSQATVSAASPAEGGDGLEGSPGLNFGAVLTRQLKGIAALREQKVDAGARVSSLSALDGGIAALLEKKEGVDAIASSPFTLDGGIAALLEQKEGAGPVLAAVDGVDESIDESAVNAGAVALPIDLSVLTASLLVPASPVQVGAGVAASSVKPFLRRDGSEGGVDGSSIASGMGEEELLTQLPKDGGIRLAAEIAANGKNFPQVAPQEELFADKLAVLVEVSKSDAGEEFHSVDLPASANLPATTTAVVSRNPDLQPLPALPVAPRVGSAEWGGAVGEKVVWMANQSHQVAELHLNPPNLGPLEVRLTISNDQASALFVSHHSAVREAIETALPRLREMLADNGITLGNVSVGAESFSQQQASDQRSGKEGGRSGLGAESVMAQMVMSGRPSGLAHDGMVDIFA